jgi:peroxiredoxin
MKAALAALITWLALAPAAPLVFAQQDVHAALIAAQDRKPAPAFDLANATGKKVRIANYRGKVVLLNFWATDCGGCILEIPSFISIQAAHKDRAFTAVGTSMDISYDGLKNADEAWGKVTPFVSSHKVNYPILMGDQAVSDAYELKAFPATYLIDKSGRVAAAYVGVVSKENVEANVSKLLSER